MAAARAEYANLTAALAYGLRTGQPISGLVVPLDEYLDQAQQHDTRRQLLDDAIAAYPEPATRQQQENSPSCMTLPAIRSRPSTVSAMPDAHYETELQLRQAAGDRRSEAVTYHQLGAVAQEQRRFADAEASYRQALDIKLEFGDRHSAASTYHQLGRVAAGAAAVRGRRGQLPPGPRHQAGVRRPAQRGLHLPPARRRSRRSSGGSRTPRPATARPWTSTWSSVTGTRAARTYHQLGVCRPGAAAVRRRRGQLPPGPRHLPGVR